MDTDEISYTPPDIQEAAKIANFNLLPEKSKIYKSFVQRRIDKKTNSFTGKYSKIQGVPTKN